MKRATRCMTTAAALLGLCGLAMAQTGEDPSPWYPKHTPHRQNEFRGEFRVDKISDEAVLDAALARVVTLLPKDQRLMLARGLQFVVGRSPKNLADTVLGWGPEDDQDYVYPSRTFYPHGSIKVNISLRMIEALRAAEELRQAAKAPGTFYDFQGKIIELRWRQDEQVLAVQAIDDLFHRVAVHEIEHAKEYVEKPVNALSKPEQCPEGLCDAERIGDTRQKAEYEFRALRRDFEVRKLQDPRVYLAAAQLLRRHSDLLTQRIKNLPERLELAAKETGVEISDFHKTYYEATHMVPSLAWAYLKTTAETKVEHAKSLSDIQKYFDFNCGQNELKAKDVLTDDYPYLAPVFKATVGTSKCP
ncbi:MAG: hypothetical protein HY921_11605 [Elusimicrobia bacterium]|nr:hypothetical protein [Elusimicrobiota bacterium]